MKIVRWNGGKWHAPRFTHVKTFCGVTMPRQFECINAVKKSDVPDYPRLLCLRCFD